MEKVTGIGGIFFRAKDPQALRLWYQQHLGVTVTPTTYEQLEWRQEAGPTGFEPFPEDASYFGSPRQVWMINFRVRNLVAMVTQLEAAGVKVTVDPENYPNGRFARVHDPDSLSVRVGRSAVTP
ncbi:MAG: VOC family protein [Acidobacteriia bacterium]|nr:VOC family protein [Terriglobia bacterium]